MKKVKKKNLLQFQMYFSLDWHVIKHSYTCLSVNYMNITIIVNVGNSLIFFSHKKSGKSLFSSSKNGFSSQQKHFNLMWIIHILVCLLLIFVYFSFVHETVKQK